jgi:hypothetical protein
MKTLPIDFSSEKGSIIRSFREIYRCKRRGCTAAESLEMSSIFFSPYNLKYLTIFICKFKLFFCPQTFLVFFFNMIGRYDCEKGHRAVAWRSLEKENVRLLKASLNPDCSTDGSNCLLTGIIDSKRNLSSPRLLASPLFAWVGSEN